MAREHYRRFIEEAFIAPIRSVLIVDDDYPTYDEILKTDDGMGARGDAHARKAWRRQRERVANVIGAFRRRRPPLLVDIHDGANVPTEGNESAATHLHQCDLLVLDYELDRDRPGDGSRAIGILAALMSNLHFNLVIIYTNEDLDVVFDAVRWGLVTPSTDVLSDGEIENAKRWIDDGEDEFEDFERDLHNTIGSAQYFHSRMHGSSYLRTMVRAQEPYALFNHQADRVNWSRDQRKLVLKYLLRRLERANDVPSNTANRFSDLEWSVPDPRWLKSNSAFVALSRKTGDDDDLLTDLGAALNHWSPRPSRLFLTKVRAEIDEYGVAVQSAALSNHFALAYWYFDLLESGDAERRRWRVSESVSRHAGQLMQTVLPRVEEYVTRLIEAEVAGGNSVEICKGHFAVNLDNDAHKRTAMLEHNAFVCSMEPTGWHLSTGHVFSMLDDHWLCLSPTCDMVPSQLPTWRTDATGERLPFIGVKLLSIRSGKALRDIHSNRFVFLGIGGEVKCYSFNDPSRDGSAPHWYTLYAEKRGRLSLLTSNSVYPTLDRKAVACLRNASMRR